MYRVRTFSLETPLDLSRDSQMAKCSGTAKLLRNFQYSSQDTVTNFEKDMFRKES